MDIELVKRKKGITKSINDKKLLLALLKRTNHAISLKNVGRA